MSLSSKFFPESTSEKSVK